MTDWQPRLKWRRTWTDVRDDYIADAPDGLEGFCRVYCATVGQSGGAWHWTAATWRQAGSGYSHTPGDAARLAEAALALGAERDQLDGKVRYRRLSA